MNKHIKQFERESNLDVYGLGLDRAKWATAVGKFAELIVRGCVEQIITGPNGPAHYAVEAAVRVKKHFGVAE